jgi:hypothetical protein
MTWKTLAMIGIPAIVLGIGSPGMVRAGNLVMNGDFGTTTNGNGQLGVGTNATDWTSGSSGSPGYNFLFEPGTADTTGAAGLYLWGPAPAGGGVDNGLTASSPAGGNFVALGGDPNLVLEPISQTITNLTPTDQYVVSFYWAGAQQSGASGATTDQLQVSLGGQSISTAVVDNASEGFTGWMQESFTFTATSGTEALSFFAIGGPAGLPPFVLLNGITMTAVPEPSSLMLTATGLLCIGGVYLRRRVRSAAV